MPYVLGVHLGATATSAAIARRDGSKWAAAVPLPLGSAGPTVPTVLCKVQDGSFLAGEDARRQELSHHEWVVRGFTRLVGDESPLLVGHEFVSAQRLAAAVIEWVADLVAHQQGYPPEHITVAHSATWGPHRTHLVYQELSKIGLSDVTLLPEPVAVALDFGDRQRVAENAPIAIGNVGGSGFDATILRRRAPTFDVIGPPLDASNPSGQDLDDAIFEHVRTQIGDYLAELDLSELPNHAAVSQLRQECARTKEALSYHSNASVRIDLPEGQTQLGLSRSKFEHLARPHLERVPDLLLQALQSASLKPEELSAVVLAGGVARTPLAKQLVAQRLEQQPLVDVAPELVAARGAAVSAVEAVSTATDQSASVEQTSVLMSVSGSNAGESEEDENDAPSRPPVNVEPMYLEPVNERRKRTMRILKLSAAAVFIVVGMVLTFTGHWSGGKSQSPTGVVQQHR